jgi:glycolate oxidase
MNFEKVTLRDIEHLREICGVDTVLWKEEISPDYSHDELSLERYAPEAVVLPQSTSEVSAVLAYCYERNIPVIPRGSGTGLCGGAVAIHGGVLLVTTKMNRILEIDQENLVAIVEPGVLLMELQAQVEELDLFYAPDPGEKTATIGGNVSTNAGGMRAIKYGVTRDFVLGLEAVLPDGRIIETGGKVMKNSSGYSLTDLLIGSEGTLAIITKIILRLLPKPKRKLSLVVPFDGLSQAVSTVPRILSAGDIPCALEFFQREVLEAASEYLGRGFPHSGAQAYLMLSFFGNDALELEKIYERVAEVCLQNGAHDVLIAHTTDRQASLWENRGAFLEALKAMGDMDEVDVVVPPNQVATFIQFTEDLRVECGLPIVSFGHAGDGNLHIYILRGELDRTSWLVSTKEAMDRIYAKAKELKGLVSGEHGIGFAKREYLHQSVSPDVLELMRSIKRSFDPKGLLNPGKVC